MWKSVTDFLKKMMEKADKSFEEEEKKEECSSHEATRLAKGATESSITTISDLKSIVVSPHKKAQEDAH